MVIKRKKVLILFCGSIEDVTQKNLPNWLKQMPELDIIADIESIYIKVKQANFFSPNFWQDVAATISQKQKKYNGFVIIHPVETLLYTAAAQSFLLHHLKKPIIFTGAQKNENYQVSQLNIKANLINATQVATFNLPEVAVMFGNKLLRANQANRVSNLSLNTFEAPEFSVLAKIDFSIRLMEKNLKKIKVVSKFKNLLNENIEYIKIQPVFNLSELSERIQSKAGIFIEGNGHTLPPDLELLISNLENKIPVILYDVVKISENKNIISIENMTLETALVKFMYVLAQTKKINAVKKLMQTDIAGEIID